MIMWLTVGIYIGSIIGIMVMALVAVGKTEDLRIENLTEKKEEEK